MRPYAFLGLFLPIFLPIVAAQNATSIHYAQPALPIVSAVTNSSSWQLDPAFEITDVPQIREYWWDINVVASSPDGYPRQAYAINNMMPGPLIEANEGDTVKVHVTNHLSIGQTIHWHGIYQNGSQWMDGVPGVSQCPIAPGQTFTYEFKINSQYGTYWWHSHFANTMADGLAGGLIVHSVNDPVKRGIDFDEEMVVVIQDWMDLQSTDVATALNTLDGYRGSGAAPQGDAILINGIGRTNCSNGDIQDPSEDCILPTIPEIAIPVNKRIKLRFINGGSLARIRVSIDSHPFDVVELDDTAVWGPTGIHEAFISVGQRMSVIIDTNQGNAGDSFFLRSTIVTSCIGRVAFDQTGFAVLRYVDEDGNSSSSASTNSTAWPDLQGDAALCQDIDAEYPIVPRIAKDAPTDIVQTHVMASNFGTFVRPNGSLIGTYAFNNISFQSQIGDPLLTQIQAGADLNGSLVAHATYDKLGGADLIINNLEQFTDHPYHLHGKSFFIIARGSGEMTIEQWEKQRAGVNITNPFRRDVLEIPRGNYAVLRLVTDLPGVWPLHCHIGWHLSTGKMAVIVVQPDAIRAFPQPDHWKNLCSAWARDEIGPARRAVSHGSDNHRSAVLTEQRMQQGRRGRYGP